jgi:glycosyltransferase involved in cell wall biosynthesis
MRVGVDGRSLSAGERRGVARVTFELLAAMAARFPQDDWRVLLPGGAGDCPAGASAYRTRIPGRVLFGSAAVAGRPRIDAVLGGVDVVWLPAPAPVAISRTVPSVLTLHDMSWVERPRDFSPYERAWHLLARPRAEAQRAVRVAAVSEQTRRIALERWRLDPARITVIAPPVAACSALGGATDSGRDPYFLWVGALEPRKAPEVLEAAWSTARGRGLAARLVVVGEGRVPLTGPGVERRGHVTDAELGALYHGALALVLPSRLEGAGLTPLEAALHGTPSICSGLEVLRDSLGPDGAQWVAPGDAEALAESLLAIAGDPELRARIAAAAGRAAAPRADPGPPAVRMRTLLADAAQR